MQEQELFDKLERSWRRLCEDFARREFFTVSENDITCYLYHSLVVDEGVAKNYIHTDFPVRIEGKHVDIFLGRNHLTIEADGMPLLVEIKLWKRRLDYYLFNYESSRSESSFFGDDVKRLISLKSAGSGVCAAFFQKLPPSPYYDARVLYSEKPGENPEDITAKYWAQLESVMKELESKLKNGGIRLLYGPRLEFYKKT